jgi:hypothetical protein
LFTTRWLRVARSKEHRKEGKKKGGQGAEKTKFRRIERETMGNVYRL